MILELPANGSTRVEEIRSPCIQGPLGRYMSQTAAAVKALRRQLRQYTPKSLNGYELLISFQLSSIEHSYLYVH